MNYRDAVNGVRRQRHKVTGLSLRLAAIAPASRGTLKFLWFAKMLETLATPNTVV
jgi:hypothetical protein